MMYASALPRAPVENLGQEKAMEAQMLSGYRRNSFGCEEAIASRVSHSHSSPLSAVVQGNHDECQYKCLDGCFSHVKEQKGSFAR